jgi:ABC-type multidrug transport system fused ATPase/permease subunit
LYFQESLAHQICDLINVSWKIWLAVFIAVIPIAITKSVYPMDSETAKKEMSSYVNWYLIVTLLLTALTGLTVFQISRLRKRLLTAVDGLISFQGSGSTISSEDEDSQHEDSEDSDDHLSDMEKRFPKWCQFLADCLQFLSLSLCFCLGSYILHLLHNLGYYGDYLTFHQAVYHVIFILVFIGSLLLLFPLALVEITSVQAFVVPDEDVLATITTLVRDARQDLALIGGELRDMAQTAGYTDEEGPRSAEAWAVEKLTETNGGDPTIMRMQFKHVCTQIGVKLQVYRALGVFDLVDNEHAAQLDRGNSLGLKVKNCCEDFVDVQISVEELVDSAFRSAVEAVMSTRSRATRSETIHA